MTWSHLFATPAYAATIPLLEGIKQQIVNPLIGLLFAVALLYFLWGVSQFIYNSADEQGREKGKQHILWGLIGLLIMVSVFGIINLICRTVGAC